MSESKKITDDLLKEKSIADVYSLSKHLKCSYLTILPSIVILLSVLAFLIFKGKPLFLVDQVRVILDLGITVASTILGFLIAGFAVFSSLTNPKLFVKMASLKSDTTGLSWVKEVFITFMHVFIHYTYFLISAVLVKILTLKNGLIPSLLNVIPSDTTCLKSLLAISGFVFFTWWLMYLLMLLPMFIFNTYSSAMMSIAVINEELLDDDISEKSE